MSNRYVIGVDLGGNAEQKMNDLAKGVDGMIRQLDMLNKHQETMGKSLDSIAGSERAHMLMEVADRFSEVSEKIEHAAHKLIETVAEGMKEVVKDASMFEDAQSELQFAFGENWKSTYDKLLQTSQHLTFTFGQTLSLANQLGRLHVDPYGGAIKAAEGFKGKTGEILDAFEVLQDVTAGTGRNIDSVSRDVMEAMVGNMRGLKMGLNLPHELIQKITNETKKATDQQGKYNAVIKELAAFFGGAGKLKAENYSMQLLQVTDVMEQLKGRIGLGGLKDLSRGVADFVSAIKSLLEDKDKVNALADGFAVLERAVAQVIHWVAGAVRWFGELIKTMPWLPKLIGYMTVASIVGLTLVATAMGLAASFMAVSLAAAAMGAELMFAGAALTVLLIPAIIAVGLFAVVAGLALKVMFEGLTEDLGGAGTALERFKMVFEGLSELIKSYNGATGTMSIETAAKLKKAGLFEFVTDAFKVFHRFSVMWESFMEGIGDIYDKAGPSVMEFFDEIKGLLEDIDIAFGLTSGFMEDAASNSDEWADKGRSMAEIVGDLVKGLVEFGTATVHEVRSMMTEWEALMLVWDKAALALEKLNWVRLRMASFGTDKDKAGLSEAQDSILKHQNDIAEREMKNEQLKLRLDQEEAGLGAKREFHKRAFKQNNFGDTELRQLAGMTPDESGPPPAAEGVASGDYNARRRQRERAHTMNGGVPLEQSGAYQSARYTDAEQRAGTGQPLNAVGPPVSLSAESIAALAAAIKGQPIHSHLELNGHELAHAVSEAGETTGGIR